MPFASTSACGITSHIVPPLEEGKWTFWSGFKHSPWHQCWHMEQALPWAGSQWNSNHVESANSPALLSVLTSPWQGVSLSVIKLPGAPSNSNCTDREYWNPQAESFRTNPIRTKALPLGTGLLWSVQFCISEQGIFSVCDKAADSSTFNSENFKQCIMLFYFKNSYCFLCYIL